MDITIYPDGSGASALVRVKGWDFSMNFLGEVRCNLITQSSSRKPPKWAAEWAKKTFMKELESKATPEWFALNKAMYADVVGK